MGQAKRRISAIGHCIYCGAANGLSDEHVIPYALGGTLVLYRASCEPCQRITGQLEQRLLRKHWWAIRQRLNLPTRSGEFPETMPVDVERADGTTVPAQIPTAKSSIVMQFAFSEPAILKNEIQTGPPVGPVSLTSFGDAPRQVFIEGQPYDLKPQDKLIYPVNMDASDVARFLAKIAHGYAVSRHGVNACREFFLPPFILGDGDGILTYVGCRPQNDPGPAPGGPVAFGVILHVNGPYLIVSIQLFRTPPMATPPIYDVIVGRVP